MATESVATPEFYAAQTFDAYITDGEMREMNKHASDPNHACSRTIALAFLTRSKAQHMERVTTVRSAEALLKGVEAVTAYREHLEAVVAVMRSAEVRMHVVLETAAQRIPELASED